MDKFKTYMWKEDWGSKWYRIQTNDPDVIRKLRKRKNMTLSLWCMNDSMVIFRTQYYSLEKAKKSLQRLLGQKVKKDAENGEFYAETTPILDSNFE